MSFNRDFRWMTNIYDDESLIYQTFADRAVLHLRPKNTSNHITKFITVSSQDESSNKTIFYQYLTETAKNTVAQP